MFRIYIKVEDLLIFDWWIKLIYSHQKISFMAKPALVQVFGASATQNSNTLTISKTDLAATGLTASSDNTSEELLVALVKLWQSVLTSTNQDANPEQQVTIEDSFQQITTRNNIQYRQFSKTINLQIVDATTTIDPDDF